MFLLVLLRMIFFVSRCNFLNTPPFTISFLTVWEKLTPRRKKISGMEEVKWPKLSSKRTHTIEKALYTNDFIEESSIERVTRGCEAKRKTGSRKNATETTAMKLSRWIPKTVGYRPVNVGFYHKKGKIWWRGWKMKISFETKNRAAVWKNSKKQQKIFIVIINAETKSMHQSII